MDFNKATNPATNIYKDLLLKLYNQYIYHTGKSDYKTIKYALQPAGLSQSYISPASSIDDILVQDTRAVFDKVKNTALSIAYRIKISKNIDRQMDYNWYTLSSELASIESFYPARDRGSERRRGMLTSELFKVYKNKLDEQVQCWKDLQEPFRYFINLFHKYKGLGQDKKLLEEK